MTRLFQLLRDDLLRDEAGFIVSAELVIIATVVVLGMITGLKCIQVAMIGELKDVSGAIGSLNQSYSYSGFSKRSLCGCDVKAYTRGSMFVDYQDECDVVNPCEIGELPVPATYIIESQNVETAPCDPGAIVEEQGIVLPAPTEGSNCPGGCDDQPFDVQPTPAPNAEPEPTVPPSPADPAAEQPDADVR